MGARYDDFDKRINALRDIADEYAWAIAKLNVNHHKHTIALLQKERNKLLDRMAKLIDNYGVK